MKQFMRMWPTWWTLPLFAILIYFMPEIILFIDPQGAVIRNDFWQHVLYAALIVVIFNDFAFAGIAINHPPLFQWYRENFQESSSASAWLLFAWYAVLMICMVLVLIAIV